MEIPCPHCKKIVDSQDAFCGFCGKKIGLIQEKKENSSLQLVIIFYLTFLVFAIVSFAILDESASLGTEIAIEAVFILLTLLFCLFDIKPILALYNWKQVNWKNLLFSLGFPVFTAITVYFSVGWLNDLIFYESTNVFYEYEDYNNTVFWVIVFYAIIPPIFEELAFRGFLFNQLRTFASVPVTILATAFIFALVHFSYVSLLWIFPFGLVLGYIRHKYNTLWLGMMIHFVHNFLVVLIDYYYYQQDLLLTF
ncbi:MAG: CPBP family glutamic-type intramembrane protease [Bacteroidota bacterium]